MRILRPGGVVLIAGLAVLPGLSRAAVPGEAGNVIVTALNPDTGELSLTWQAGCEAAGHHLIYGPLSQVATYGYAGQVCGLGMGGNWTGSVPPGGAPLPGDGSVFFLVVADDNAGIEGAYGLSFDGEGWAERPASGLGGACPFTRQLVRVCDLPAAPSVALTGYRQQTQTYGQIFLRRAIPEAQEQTPGAGIRINGDDDNANATPDRNEAPVTAENDLIEVELDADLPPPYGVEYVLIRTNPNVRVWSSALKATELLTSGDVLTLDLPASGQTVWLENPTGGAADVRLAARAVSSQVEVATDTLHTFPFTSIVIALGGESQVPDEPLLEPTNHGTFKLAIDLYDQGYDVHMYDEDVVIANGSGAAYNEVVRAVSQRGVGSVAIFGYSHGGGSTTDLAVRLNANRATIGSFVIPLTAYVDGIENDSDFDLNSENDLPPTTQYHASYYQNPGCGFLQLCGAPVPGADLNLNVNTTPWGAGLDHFEIDDAPEVLQGIMDAILIRVTR